VPLPTRCCAGTVPMPFPAPRPSAASPPVTVLKPVHGVDEGAYENFSSCCREDDPYEQIVFDVLQEMHDVRRLIKQIVETIGWMSQANVRQALAAFQDELGQNLEQKLTRPARESVSGAGDARGPLGGAAHALCRQEWQIPDLGVSIGKHLEISAVS
jgi:hypothetical protein